MSRLFAVTCFVVMIAVSPVTPAADEYSAAEQRIFLDDHMKNIAKAGTVDYRYTQSGAVQDNFDGAVKLIVGEGAASQRTLAVDYLSGKQKLELPSVDGATGNPVILHFLEHDIRNMHERLGGQQAYFRKRIRLALADAATVRTVKRPYKGKTIDAQEITIAPYIQDSLKDRFGQFAAKVYVFVLSDAVPGAVYELRTSAAATTGTISAPAVTTSLTIDPR